jgi:hypothetical protein
MRARKWRSKPPPFLFRPKPCRWRLEDSFKYAFQAHRRITTYQDLRRQSVSGLGCPKIRGMYHMTISSPLYPFRKWTNMQEMHQRDRACSTPSRNEKGHVYSERGIVWVGFWEMDELT